MMDWTKEQVEARKFYIGGSDAAAVLGLSNYKTPLQVWALKTGRVTPQEISDKICVRVGNKLEQTVAELFMEDTGKKLKRVNETIFHPKYKFIGANIDRLVVGEDAGFEAKTTNEFKNSAWREDEIPIEYLCQCLHYMAVTGKKTWYIAVLIGNSKFLWKKVEWDSQSINKLIKKEVYFWNTFVVPNIMPMQISSKDSSVLDRVFPKEKEKSIIELGDDAQKVCESLDSLQADYKVLEKEIEEQKNTLKGMLKNNEIGVTLKYRITWKTQKERRLDLEKLKIEHPEIYKKYAPGRDKRFLRISVIKEAK